MLEKPGTNSVNLQREEISTGLQLGCWFTGTLLAAAGIYLAVLLARTDARGPRPPGYGVAAPVAAPDPAA